MVDVLGTRKYQEEYLIEHYHRLVTGKIPPRKQLPHPKDDLGDGRHVKKRGGETVRLEEGLQFSDQYS